MGGARGDGASATPGVMRPDPSGRTRPTRRGVSILFLGALASTYVLLIGLAMKGAVTGAFEMGQVSGPGYWLSNALAATLGEGPLRTAAVAAILAAWACRSSRPTCTWPG